jgi:hypothetical protein
LAATSKASAYPRHNPPPRGDVFLVGVATEDGILVAVGIAGRPVARRLNNGQRVEVTSVAAGGTRNACSMLYGALARAAFALGYTRIITYTQSNEPGTSLRAAGYRVVAQRPAHRGWNRPSPPPRRRPPLPRRAHPLEVPHEDHRRRKLGHEPGQAQPVQTREVQPP